MKKLLVLIFLSATFVNYSCESDSPSPTEKTGVFTDARDNHVYKWVKIGTQTWMAENLAYKPNTGDYWAYNNDESNVEVYGYLYLWETALTVAPAGWHIPTKDELRTLVEGLGGEEAAYNKMLEKGTEHWLTPNSATNESGFTALPAGYYSTTYNEFRGMGEWTFYHSSTEYLGNEETSSMGVVLNRNFLDASIEGSSKLIGRSIRCIKD